MDRPNIVEPETNDINQCSADLCKLMYMHLNIQIYTKKKFAFKFVLTKYDKDTKSLIRTHDV